MEAQRSRRVCRGLSARALLRCASPRGRGATRLLGGPRMRGRRWPSALASRGAETARHVRMAIQSTAVTRRHWRGVRAACRRCVRPRQRRRFRKQKAVAAGSQTCLTWARWATRLNCRLTMRTNSCLPTCLPATLTAPRLAWRSVLHSTWLRGCTLGAQRQVKSRRVGMRTAWGRPSRRQMVSGWRVARDVSCLQHRPHPVDQGRWLEEDEPTMRAFSGRTP
jgi:hypothetical protein